MEDIDLSDDSQEASEKHYQTKPPIKGVVPPSPLISLSNNDFVRYQQELIAFDVLRKGNPPKPPGEILKLPPKKYSLDDEEL